MNYLLMLILYMKNGSDSGDIRNPMWYKIEMEDEQGNDGYLDTIYIKKSS